MPKMNKIGIILCAFLCISIAVAGCSSPSTSNQANYQQQNYQQSSSSNVDPIVGCWVNTHNVGRGITSQLKFEFDSGGGGYVQTTVSGSQGTKTGDANKIIWTKLSSTDYGVSTGTVLTRMRYSQSSNTLTEIMESGSNLIYYQTSC